MDNEALKKLVIEEAKKIIFEGKGNSAKQKISEETTKTPEVSITPEDVFALAEEMKKINKKIDLNHPLINESVIKFIDEASSETQEEKTEIVQEESAGLRDRELDVDKINKSKHVNFQNENEKDTWKRILGYDVPTDEDRAE